MPDIKKSFMACLTLVAAALVAPASAMATGVLGEYSFLHVTFGSVWHLFLFIFTLVMIPFVLLIFVSWRFRKIREDEPAAATDRPASDDAKEE